MKKLLTRRLWRVQKPAFFRIFGAVLFVLSVASQSRATLANLPLSFERVQPPGSSHAQFFSRGDGYAILLQPDVATVALPRPGGNSASIRLRLAGAATDAEAEGLAPLPGRMNYFVGNDPARWQRNLPTFAKVKYPAVYSGVDLIYYGNQRRLEYDFDVGPGADAGQIALQIEGADRAQITPQGELELALSGNSVRWQRPVAWQKIDGKRVEIACAYVVQGQTVRFRLAAYDRAQRLVIDPVLLYSTYIGGADSTGDNAQAVTTDAAGNVYFTGSVSSFNFIDTISPLRGASDAYVVKLDSTGTNIIFGVFVGGSGTESGQAIALDGQGRILIGGVTSSSDFPVTNGFQTVQGSGFLAELSADGSNIVYSTYVGGSTYYDSVTGVGVDAKGKLYATGDTASTTFPLTPGALRRNPPAPGRPCGFVVKLDPTLNGTNSLIYSTFLGGSNYDFAHALAVNAAGNAYVAGAADSTNFPTTPGAYQTNFQGFTKFFISELNTTGTALVFSTLLGGSGSEGANSAGIALDADGNVYVTGQTASKDFPVTPGAAQPVFGGGATQYADSGDAFITKLNPTGTALLWSTYLGGALDDGGTSLALDTNRNVYVTGITSSFNLPARQPLYPNNRFDAYKTTNAATNWSGLVVGSKAVNLFAVDPLNSSNVYAGASRNGTDPVLYKSADAGLTWAASDTGLPTNYNFAYSFFGSPTSEYLTASVDALAVAPSDPSVLYAGFNYGFGIYKSADAGASWSIATNGLPLLTGVYDNDTYTIPVSALAVDPHNPSNVFAAVGASTPISGGIYHSTNGGLNWTLAISGGFEAVTFDPKTSSIIYAANNNDAGFFKSGDGGNTWSNLNSGLPASATVQSIAVDPANTAVVYAGIGGYYGGGIYKSVNAGTNWFVTGETFGAIASIVFDSGDSETLYACQSYQSSYYGALVSTNGGTNWATMNTGIQEPYGQIQIYSLAADPLRPGAVYAATELYNQNAFVAKLDATGSFLAYSTYLGGTQGDNNTIPNDTAFGIAVDAAGNAWVAGQTTCVNFPVTTNAYQPNYEGYQSAFISKVGSLASADLALTLSASATQAAVGSNVTYTIVVTNRGPANATSVTVSDTLPPALAFQSATLSQGSYQSSGQILTCNLGALAKGSSATLSLTVMATLTGPAQSFALVTANENDPVLSNNLASINTTLLQNPARHTDLALGMTVTPSPALLGYNFTYILGVTNLGPDAASGVVLTDALPPSVAVATITPSQGTASQVGKSLTCNFGALSAGASATLTVVATPALRGTITNIASVTGNESDPNLANNSITRAMPVTVATLQVGQSGPIPEQASQDFIVTVTNVGPDAVGNIVLTITPPALAVAQSASASQGSAVVSNALVIASLGALNAGSGATVNVTASGPATTASYSTVVQGSSSGVLLFTQTHMTAADVGIGGKVTPNPSVAGQTVTFTCNITNFGPDVAKNVTTQVGFDYTSMTVLSATTTSGMVSSYLYGSVTYYEIIIPTMNPGATAQATFEVQVRNAPLIELLPFLESSDQPDPNPANNALTYNGEYNEALWLPFTNVAGSGLLSFSQSAYNVPENGGVAYLPVVRQGGAVGNVSVLYSTGGGSAIPGVNYAPVSGVLNFAPGQTSQPIVIPVFDDGVYRPNQTVNVVLNGVSGGYLAAPASATLTIDETDFPKQTVGSVRLISAAITNTPLLYGNKASTLGACTPDGRFVAFNSTANNLAAGDHNGLSDAFLRDMSNNLVLLLSVNPNGVGANSNSYVDSISADGRYIVFESDATDLVPGDFNGERDVFVRDTVLDQTKLVSASQSDGGFGEGYSSFGLIGGDRYIAFDSYSTNLVPQPTTGQGDVFVRDLLNNTTALVSLSASGAAGSSDGSYLDAISPDGRYILFDSDSSNLTAVPVTNFVENLYLRDLVSGATTLLTTDRAGAHSASDYSESPVITPDGHFAAFASYATNLTSDRITNGYENVFLRDLVDSATVLISINTNGLAGNNYSYNPVLSSNGQVVVFQSSASDLALNDANNASDIFARNTVSNATRLVSVNTTGIGGGSGSSVGPVMTPDARFVAFTSYASNLATNTDNNTDEDVFIADLLSNKMTLVSVNTSGRSGSAASSAPFLSTNGQFVVFDSGADDLTSNAPFNIAQIYRRDLDARVTLPASAAFSRTGNTGSPPGDVFTMSADGRWVAFATTATNLVPDDANLSEQAFVDDLVGNTMTLLSVNTNGVPSSGQTSDPFVSAEGNVVIFESYATDLAPNSSAATPNFFARELPSGPTTLVSVNSNGAACGQIGSPIAVTPDGRYVVFATSADNLVPNTTNYNYDNIYVRDRVANTTMMVNLTTNGLPGNFGGSYFHVPAISSNGRLVAFHSSSDWLVPGVSNSTGNYDFYQIYVRDMVAGTNTLVSATPAGKPTTNSYPGVYFAQPIFSADDRYVLFDAVAPDLTAGNTNLTMQVYLRDLTARQTQLLSVNNSGAIGNAGADDLYPPAITADDRYVVFTSGASNLVSLTDSNNADDVFIRDLIANTTTLVSVNASGSGPGNAASDSPAITPDGHYVTFRSAATDLVPGRIPVGAENIYRRDLVRGVTLLLSPNLSGTAASDDSYNTDNFDGHPAISADGSVIAFFTSADDLTPQDLNMADDLFAFDFGGETNTADLALSIASPAAATVGVNFTYTIAVTNLGPTNASAVLIANSFPAGLTFVSAHSSKGVAAFANGSVTCSGASLAPGAVLTLSVTVTPQTAGVLYNGATVSATQPDLNPLNNSAEAVIAISAVTGPSIAILVDASGHLHISWATGSTSYTLETTANLSLPDSWVPVTNTIATNGSNLSLTLTNTFNHTNHFYRLHGT